MIDQKEQQQLVPESQLIQTGTKFTKSEGGKRYSKWWTAGESLPYPFGGMEELMSGCQAINLAVLMSDGVLYQLQSVSLASMPILRVH
jgi:hypothetical protein